MEFGDQGSVTVYTASTEANELLSMLTSAANSETQCIDIITYNICIQNVVEWKYEAGNGNTPIEVPHNCT